MARCGFKSSAEEAVGCPSAVPGSWRVPGERPRGCTSPQSPPCCAHPGFGWKTGNTACQRGKKAATARHAQPILLHWKDWSEQTHGVFWSQKKISPLLFLALDLGTGVGAEIIILQLVREKPFSANPPPGEQMRDARRRKRCKAIALR